MTDSNSHNSLKQKIFDQIDPANMYINNFIHFYDINKLLKKIKSQDELKFEDRIVQIGKHLRDRGQPRGQHNKKIQEVNYIAETLEAEIKNELKNMFSKQFDTTKITNEKYVQIVDLLINELNYANKSKDKE